MHRSCKDLKIVSLPCKTSVSCVGYEESTPGPRIGSIAVESLISGTSSTRRKKCWSKHDEHGFGSTMHASDAFNHKSCARLTYLRDVGTAIW